MANEPRPPQQDRLPIKLIMPKQGAERKIPPGGTPPKPFRAVDSKYRKHLSNQVSALRSAIVPQVRRTEVLLFVSNCSQEQRPRAIDRNTSSRPKSCPIIGSGRLGELSSRLHLMGLIVWRR